MLEHSDGAATEFATIVSPLTLAPVNKVLAVKNRDPREKLKGAVYHIIVVACAADTWVRIESGEDWIPEGCGLFL